VICTHFAAHNPSRSEKESKQDAEGLHQALRHKSVMTIEFEERLCRPNPDTNGGRRFNTEVIVRNRILTVLSPVAETVQ
jgi:hypothetical protein